MKRVLIVTYYWPPSGGPGVQRCLKFVKYLRSFNIEPIVVTVDETKASYPVLDESLSSEIPQGVKVYRTGSFEPLRFFSSVFSKEKVPYAAIPDRSQMSLAGKLSLFVRANFFIPDARRGWNNYAFRECSRIIREEKIDAVLTSSPPHSSQLIGLRLKKKFGIKWIADLRDPWTNIYYYDRFHHTRFAKKLDMKYESGVLNQADHVIVTSQHTASLFAKKISKDKAAKIKVITNGFDPADFSGIIPEAEKKFTITFVGTIGMQFGITGFADAVKQVADAHPDIPFSVRFVGKMDDETRNMLREKLADKLDIVGYVSHKESIRFCCNSHLLLLVIPKGENHGTVPGKTFEYLATHKPVLCLAPDGSSAGEIIRMCEAGETFAHENSAGMAAYIGALLQKWNSGQQIDINNNNFMQYSRVSLTGKLAELFNH